MIKLSERKRGMENQLEEILTCNVCQSTRNEQIGMAQVVPATLFHQNLKVHEPQLKAFTTLACSSPASAAVTNTPSWPTFSANKVSVTHTKIFFE